MKKEYDFSNAEHGKFYKPDIKNRIGGIVKPPTESQLRAMTPEQRKTVRSNALKRGGEIANATIVLIDSLDLPLSSGGMSLNDPQYLEMQKIIWSAEGKAAAILAVEQGMPAMAGIDPMLQKAMGTRYGRESQGTANAGSLVAELMRYHGYEKTGEATLPHGCVAKTAATWLPKSLIPNK